MPEMQTARDASELSSRLDQRRSACSAPVVLVPTMGALHLGHLSLIHIARQHAGDTGTVVVSIFVNPIQFDRPGDLEAYPRPLDDDLTACRTAGADIVYIPDASDMYAGDRSVCVSETSLSRHLCGAARPGHFDGVCTVCLKLFLRSRCDAAVFGEKDFQQLSVIRRMVRDLDVPVDIITAPTLRESDGLAMSSRNARLNPAQRAAAPIIHHALREASILEDPPRAAAHARTLIENSPLVRIDYLELVDAQTLQPATFPLKKPAILAIAVFFDSIRIIDHITIFG